VPTDEEHDAMDMESEDESEGWRNLEREVKKKNDLI
jgi:hypothetical protein